MRSFLTFILSVFIVLPLLSQNLEEILVKHYESSGVEAKLKRGNVKMDVSIEMMGHKLSQVLYFGEGGNFRMEVQSMGMGMNIIKSENSFFMTRDDSLFTLLEPAQSKEYYFQSELEGVLYNYQEKGHELEYLGMKDFKGETYHGIAVKLFGKDELSAVLYLDAESYLMKVQLEWYGSPQHPQQKATLFEEYKEFEGMMVATSIKSYMGGPDPITMVVDQVQTNVSIPDGIFLVNN